MQALGLVWGNVDPRAADLHEVVTQLPAPVHFGAKLLLERWRLRKTEGEFVVGRDIPSRVLAAILRNLALFEPLNGGEDFQARLAGTAFMRRFGRDIAGLKLSEIFEPKSFERHRARMAEIAETGTPLGFEVEMERNDRVFLHFEVLRLPVLAPDRVSTWILSGLFYYDWL
jgi:hypothetical protein